MTDVATYTTSPVPATTEIRQRLLQFEDVLAMFPNARFGDNDDCPLKHSFAPGIYVREITIPRGMLLTGKIHRHCHPNFLMKGEVSVFTESTGWERIKAPHAMISAAGTKRVVFTHEETVWITVHATDKTDLKEIEKELIAPTFEEYERDLLPCHSSQ